MKGIGILGLTGRMGRAIGNAAAEAGIPVAGGIDREGRVHGDHADAAALAAASDALVDFSAIDALETHLRIAVDAGTPIVIGTTGLKPEHHAAIDEAARHIPVLQSANTSLGVNLLRGLVEQAAARLGPDWDIEVLEMHHRHKVDAPSGTALLLGQSAAKGRGATLQELSRFDRISEHPHAREEGTIGYASLRGGSVAGDHMVIFAGEGERIELGHRAESRAIFARGAVKAALWLAGKPAGRYTMQDVLGL
jgi:4-hydroxy-tetrahydrodipicolinate reductase